MYNNEETIISNQQNGVQPDVNQNKKSSTAGIVGAGVGGAMLAAGAAFAASKLVNNDEDIQEDKANIDKEIQDKIDEAEKVVAEAEEKIDQIEHSEQIRQQNETHREHQEVVRQQGETERIHNEHVRQDEHNITIEERHETNEADDDYFNEHDVQITNIGSTEVEGQELYVAEGSVDNHLAAFYSDTDGNLIAAVVDTNDSGTPDDNEWIDFTKTDLSMDNVAEFIVEPEEPDVIIGDSDYFTEHDVKISEIGETEIDGEQMLIAQGEVDNHSAAFFSNEDGELQVGIVDTNDNLEIDDTDQRIDLRGSDASMVEVAQYIDNTDIDHDVAVIAVEEDVDFNGDTVNVAEVTIDETPVVLVDQTQNGEVDLAMADENENGNLESEEIYVVTDEHIPMPTEDDITAGSDLVYTDYSEPDYNNDADIEMYDM